MRQAIPNLLWIGNAHDLRDLKSVLEREIAAVIDLAAEEPPATHAADAICPREIVSCRFPLVDGQGNPPWLIQLAIQATARLIEDRVPTLVACGGGMSRSPAIVAAALATLHAVPLEDALLRVDASGPHDPSPGLLADIKQFLRS